MITAARPINSRNRLLISDLLLPARLVGKRCRSPLCYTPEHVDVKDWYRNVDLDERAPDAVEARVVE